MSNATSPRPISLDEMPPDPFTSATKRRVSSWAIAIGAVVVGALSWLPFGGFNAGRWVVVSLLAYLVGTYAITYAVAGRRQAADRLATALVMSAFVIVMLPLVSVAFTVLQKGLVRMDGEYFTGTIRNYFGAMTEACPVRLTPEMKREGLDRLPACAIGGAQHAIVGTLLVTGLAALISIPVGLLTAVYLVEYGRGRLASAITMMVDVMTGIPSIVAGLFAYALFELIVGPGTRSGLSGAVALAVLMTPVVVRSAEEMLRLVPNELREASYALGVPKWKTIAKVVIPTAIAGILTGVTLAIARVIGETAPLLVTVGLAQGTNWNPFSGRMTTLPVFTYDQYQNVGTPVEYWRDLAWAAALTLVVIVAILFTTARILSSVLKPKGLR